VNSEKLPVRKGRKARKGKPSVQHVGWVPYARVCGYAPTPRRHSSESWNPELFVVCHLLGLVTKPAELTESNDLSNADPVVPASIAAQPMRTYTANEARTRFGEFLDRAQREPVRVMRHERVVGVMVSAEDYEAMRAFCADRLQHTLDESAAAARAGLTPGALDALLSNES